MRRTQTIGSKPTFVDSCVSSQGQDKSVSILGTKRVCFLLVTCLETHTHTGAGAHHVTSRHVTSARRRPAPLRCTLSLPATQKHLRSCLPGGSESALIDFNFTALCLFLVLFFPSFKEVASRVKRVSNLNYEPPLFEIHGGLKCHVLYSVNGSVNTEPLSTWRLAAQQAIR